MPVPYNGSKPAVGRPGGPGEAPVHVLRLTWGRSGTGRGRNANWPLLRQTVLATLPQPSTKRKDGKGLSSSFQLPQIKLSRALCLKMDLALNLVDYPLCGFSAANAAALVFLPLKQTSNPIPSPL